MSNPAVCPGHEAGLANFVLVGLLTGLCLRLVERLGSNGLYTVVFRKIVGEFMTGLKPDPGVRMAMAARRLLSGIGPSPGVVALAKLVAPRPRLFNGSLWESPWQAGLRANKGVMNPIFHGHSYGFVEFVSSLSHSIL